jgi:hypothetical protein
MTDPERISKRSSGLAAELLRAGVDEQPSEVSVERTLAALGVSGAVLTTTTAAAAAGGAQLSSATAVSAGGAKAATLTLLAKWVGVGVVGGIGLASVATVATAPNSAEPAAHASVVVAPAVSVAAKKPPPAPQPSTAVVAAEEPPVDVAPSPAVAPHVAPSAAPGVAPEPVLEVGTPLAAEVAYVDRARALVASGQSAQGLALLRGYEHDFPEARLLPEVLFLQLETLERLGRRSEARAAAQRLVDGFPRSPHANRARKLLSP